MSICHLIIFLYLQCQVQNPNGDSRQKKSTFPWERRETLSGHSDAAFRTYPVGRIQCLLSFFHPRGLFVSCMAVTPPIECVFLQTYSPFDRSSSYLTCFPRFEWSQLLKYRSLRGSRIILFVAELSWCVTRFQVRCLRGERRYLVQRAFAA